MSFRLENNESRESLYERMYSFLDDQLLTISGGIRHEGNRPTENEMFSATLLNVLVTTWLHIINPALPSHNRRFDHFSVKNYP